MIDFELTDEQRLVRETARDFADNEIIPVARENDRNEHFDTDLVKKLGDMGFLGAIVVRGVRRARGRLPDLRPDRRGGRPRRLLRAHRGLGPDLARLLVDRALGHRGAEAGVAAAALHRRGARLLRPDRARHRLGRRQPRHPRDEDRRRLADLRPEAVDLDGQLRQGRADLRPDRSRAGAPRPRLLHGADQDRGVLQLGDPRQARAARLGHGGALAGRRRGRRRDDARRGRRRLQGRDDARSTPGASASRRAASGSARAASTPRSPTRRSASSSAVRSRRSSSSRR